MSSLGKGIAAASIGALLQARGYSIRMKKLDPYINVDPGTVSPYKHGEVFVMGDGCEADLDFGHYERFTGIRCSNNDSLTTGRVYKTVLDKERKGDYLGSDIQVIPHITNEIKKFITNGSNEIDFTICEIGGTVGDIEGLPYIETMRQMSVELGKARIICIHLTYIPYVKVVGEMKTKPTQHSVRQLQSMGIQPDIILCRSELPLNNEIRDKLSMFCNVHRDNVIAATDADNIYSIPSQYHSAGLDRQICRHFALDSADSPGNLMESTWKALEKSITVLAECTKIAVVGKYTKLKDAYISLVQAIMHGGFANDARVDIEWIDAEAPLSEINESLSEVSGLLVPGGFSSRGSDGKIGAIRYARENDIPFFGICLGMQLAVIEACRNVAKLATATSREFSDNGDFVVDFMESWAANDKDNEREKRDISSNLGGTMRLGEYLCKLMRGSLAHKIYGTPTVLERHRHRYEINLAQYADIFEQAGLIFSGISADDTLPEILERTDHKFFIATQAHPEFKSTPFSPHPMFSAFIKAALEHQKSCTWR